MSQNKNKIVGVISRILFKNEENGYHVLSIDSGKDLNISVTINQPHLYERVTYEFEGEWTMHPKFGHQFKATIAFEVQPTTKEGLIAYLQSDFFNGIGPVIAHRIVNHFGENVIEILNNDSEKLLEVNGISKNKLKAIQESWEKNKEINEVMMFLQQYEISTLYATKILEFYGKNCVSQVLSNPYKLSKDIEGIGFSYADKIALKVGFAEDSPERIRASINHILEQGTLEGHCYLLESQIATRSTELLKSDVKSKVTEFLHSLEKTNEIKSVSLPDEEKRYYSRKIFFNESYCSEKTNVMKENQVFIKINDKLLEIDKDTIKLSDEQLEAVRGVLGHGISVLTGGPGVGKCLKKGTEVLMFNGTKKKVEDIVKGDFLMGDDSTKRKVLSTTRGTEKMYDIISKDNKEWGCNESHILCLIYKDSRNTIINGIKYKPGDIIEISVKDYLLLSNRKKHHLKQYSTAVEYPKIQVEIPPYLLGLWLGDGGKKQNRITNIDFEIFEYGERIAETMGLTYTKNYPKNRTTNFSLSKTGNKSLPAILKKYNLWDNKHIPEIYLKNSIENRLELLAGLADSDGYYSRGMFEITQKNKSLAYDLFELSMSLGFRTKIKEKTATMKRKDGSIYRCLVYRILISGNVERIPTKIGRKKGSSKPNKNHLCSGFTLIDKGIGEYFGFELDGNKRFVLGNYIVTHNTQTTKKIVQVLRNIGKKVILAAPTGRASQRMTEVIGVEASTIHRLLSWDHINGGFLKNENNPLEADFIIIDESSMLDINLAASLLRAIQNDTQLLFIGDADQLPPVGPGDFFRDLIASEMVPVYKLNKIFRQGKESLIIKYAHSINSGETPVIETPLESPGIWTDGTDCSFVDSGVAEPYKNKNDYPKWSSLRYGLDITNMIIKLYTEFIPKYLGKEKETQILIPMNIGELGTIKVNQIIQESVNPHEKGKPEIKMKDKLFRQGDKVIQTKNNYDIGVFNGDIGRITSIDASKSELVVRFSEEREMLYKKSEIFELDLAYAISIHKSQGSEFDCVIMPITMQHYRMLYRNLIYTGLTRAKKYAIFIGQRKALEIAVENNNYEKRQTSLKLMLENSYSSNPMA